MINRPVLTKVKEKMSLSLPGWVTQEQVVAETPYSQMSMVSCEFVGFGGHGEIVGHL